MASKQRQRSKSSRNRAIASHPAEQEGHEDAPVAENVRSSGPKAMRDKTSREWDKVDEASDESFPSSDPPSHSPGTGAKKPGEGLK